MATLPAPDPITSPPGIDSRAWRAVLARDRRFDGHFVYGVRSTHVYCRPSCPSRRPLPRNVAFFAGPDDAERAGYRACRRCRPRAGENPTLAERAVAAARRYLDTHTDRAVSLAELARHTGVSASHLQRAFTRAVGLSPKQYHDLRRFERFAARLRAGDTVSRATYEAGFGSSRGVYERAGEILGMTPAEYRRGGRGVTIDYTIVNSPLGRALVAATERGVCAVHLGDSDAGLLDALRADFPNASIEQRGANPAWVRAVVDRLTDPRHACGAAVPLDVGGTAFQRRVWAALQDIPAGERRSYREIAAAVGQPSASRAVARACASNRVAVVIPCHRVVRADGQPSGYRWGEARKRQLLEDEST